MALLSNWAAPVVDGSELPVRDWRQIRRGRMRLGDAPGHVTTEQGRAGQVRIEREFFLSDDGLWAGVRLRVSPGPGRPLRLDRLIPLRLEGPAGLRLGEGGLPAWRVTRMSRHKNDVPGCYRPSQPDADMADAALDSMEIVAGGGSAGLETRARERFPVIPSEPCVYIANQREPAQPGLLIGVLGQHDHVSSIRLGSAGNGSRLGRLEVVCEADGVRVAPGERFDTHWVVLRAYDGDRAALERFTDLFAAEYRIPRPGPAPTIYCSWYFYGLTMTEEDLRENLAALRKRPVPMDAILIDNGWMDSFGTWNANARWPSGMARAAELIRRAGYQAGLWTCPFVVMSESPILQIYPDLPVRTRAGAPYGFGYVGAKTYAVDPSAPHARAYFTEMFRRFKGWGYTYHKMDFIRALAGHPDMVFHDPAVNRARASRLGLGIIRQALGPECYMLACGGLFEGSAGLTDGLRSGRDVRGLWTYQAGGQTISMVTAIKENVFRNHHNRLWHTDADAMMLRLRRDFFREHGCGQLSQGTLTDEEAFTVALNQYLGGGLVCVSERFAELPESRRALMRHVIPAHGDPAEPLDYGAPGCPTLFLTRVRPRCSGLEPWWTLAAANWGDRREKRRVRLPDRLGPGTRWAVFEFKTQTFLGIRTAGESVALTLPPHGARVLRLAPWRDAPLILGTDLHVTGGGVELAEVRAAPGRITGKVVSDWDFPVTVRAVFPGARGRVVMRAVRTRPGRRFAIRPGSGGAPFRDGGAA
jgi:hypothetical protein